MDEEDIIDPVEMVEEEVINVNLDDSDSDEDSVLDMEKDKNPEEVTIEIGTNGQEAYKTLVEWVKTVPKTINELKKNGTEEDLKTYQMQIKMVLDKLKQIELKLDND